MLARYTLSEPAAEHLVAAGRGTTCAVPFRNAEAAGHVASTERVVT